MIDKHQILLKSLYFEDIVTKDFEKYKDLVWDNDETKSTVEYYKDNIYKQITYFKNGPGFKDSLIRYFNGYNRETQNLHLHRLDGPAYIRGNTEDYFINGKHITYIKFLALTMVKPEDISDMEDLLDI
jgi:hypothetical protein